MKLDTALPFTLTLFVFLLPQSSLKTFKQQLPYRAENFFIQEAIHSQITSFKTLQRIFQLAGPNTLLFKSEIFAMGVATRFYIPQKSCECKKDHFFF